MLASPPGWIYESLDHLPKLPKGQTKRASNEPPLKTSQDLLHPAWTLAPPTSTSPLVTSVSPVRLSNNTSPAALLGVINLQPRPLSSCDHSHGGGLSRTIHAQKPVICDVQCGFLIDDYYNLGPAKLYCNSELSWRLIIGFPYVPFTKNEYIDMIYALFQSFYCGRISCWKWGFLTEKWWFSK